MKRNLVSALLVALVSLVSLSGFNADAATLVQKNVYAYALGVAKANAFQYNVCYCLNGTATAVEVQVYSNGTLAGRYVGTTKQTGNLICCDLRRDSYGNTVPSGTLTFKVKATCATVTSARLIEDKTTSFKGSPKNGVYRFFAPWTLTVNNCPDSPTFGTLLVAETRYYSSQATSTTYHSSVANGGRGPMLYAFDPQMQAQYNAQASAYGYNAAINVSTAKYSRWTSEYMHTYSALRYSEDGRLFMGTSDATNHHVVELNTSDLNALNSAATVLFSKDYASTTRAQRVVHLDVVGSGSNLKMLIVSGADGTIGGTSDTGTYATYAYNIGTKTAWGNTKYNYDCASSGTTNNFGHRVCWDPDGKGYTVTTLKSTDNVTTNAHVHYKMTSTGSARELTISANGQPYGIARNPRGDRLAVQTNANEVSLYELRNANGACNLVYLYTINVKTLVNVPDVSANWTRVNDIAFDYADNLYVCTNNAEAVASIQLPNSGRESVITPANSNTAQSGFNGTSSVTLTSSYNAGYAKLSWTASNLGDATQYVVYCKGAGESSFSAVATVTGTSYDHWVGTPQSSVSNTYYVVAQRKQVQPSGAQGSFIDLAKSSNKSVSIPAATVALTASRAANNYANLSWSATNLYNSNGYEVYRNGTKVTTTTATSFSEPLPIAGTYNYTVKALVSSAVVATSNAGSVTIDPGTIDLGVNYETEGSKVKLNWTIDNLPHATKFEIYRDDIKRATYDVDGSTVYMWNDTDRDDTEANTYYIKAYYNTTEIAMSQTVNIGFINPELTIEPEYVSSDFGDGDDISRFRAYVNWHRPLTYVYDDNATQYVLSHYNLVFTNDKGETIDTTGSTVTYKIGETEYTAEITDCDQDGIMEINDPITGALVAASNGNAVRSKVDATIGLGEDVVFTAEYPGNDILFGNYTVKITPVYIDATNESSVSMGAQAANTSSLSDAVVMGPVSNFALHGYYGVDAWGNTHYRTDFTFSAPEGITEPISYFTIERKKGGMGDWMPLDGFWVVRGDNRVQYDLGDNPGPRRVRAKADSDEADETIGYIPGDYDFGTDPGKALASASTPCVAYFQSDEDPTNDEYQVTAWYAATNEHLTATGDTQYSVNGSLATVGGLVNTGIEDVLGANSDTRVYPVPAHDHVTIDAPEAINLIEIVGLNGATVKRIECDGTDCHMTVQVNDIPVGVYMLRINERTVVRIVRNRFDP